MTDSSRLLGEFPPPGPDQWRQEVERLLKGAPFDTRMFTMLPEGFPVSPVYRAADLADVPWLAIPPGRAPFVRSTRAAGYQAAPWWVSQELDVPTCEEFNNVVREALQRGQSAVTLVLDQAAHRGCDPDQVADDCVGMGGVSVCSLSDLATALDGVDLARFPIQIESGAAAMPVAAMLIALARRRQVDPATLRGCLGSDPFAGLARRGQIAGTLSQLHDEMAALTRWANGHAPGLRTLPIFETPWHEGGADLALGLGLTLSSAVATLRAMEERGLAPEEVAPRFQFNVAVGTDFFAEMAKLRALRLLWSRVLTAAGVAPELTGAFIHARTARRCQANLDPHVNLLRSTTSAMSAVMGGADSLHVTPFDAEVGRPDRFSRRIARNVQLILAHECHFDQVTDPAGGSWYVESLTRDLATAAWERFQACEREGGMPAVLASGWAQDAIANAADERAGKLATRRALLVGVNAYPVPGWQPPTEGAHDDLRRRRSDVLSRQRTSETQEAHLLVLARLEKVMDCPNGDLFETLIEAAEAGATLGEFMGVSRGSSKPGMEVAPVPLRREAEPFEKLRTRVAALETKRPGATAVHLACLGDFARYMPRLDFAREFFRVGGFETVGDQWHDDPVAAAAAARASGSRTVVLVGLDDTYAALAADTARALGTGPADLRVILAGAPGEHADDFAAAGIDRHITARSDVLQFLGALLDELEVRS